MRYIGSKARIARAILDIIGSPSGSGIFVDAFCGSGAVAEEAARRGWMVSINDNLLAATIMAAGRLTSRGQAAFRKLGGYRGAISRLNAVRPRQGFIWAQYSPASRERAESERRYFTEPNAAKIDAVRLRIQGWSNEGLLNAPEHRLLLADLLAAVCRVANIAGTYGCFLAGWAPPALQPLDVRTRVLLPRTALSRVSTEDVLHVRSSSADTLYLDPPYTKRQYAAYYHLLETIAHGDAPTVTGVTGLRPWRDKASAFCYKRRALDAIRSVVNGSQARRVFLSYSAEGHVELKKLAAALCASGKVAVHELGEVDRYRPNAVARRGPTVVRECLVRIVKEDSLRFETVA